MSAKQHPKFFTMHGSVCVAIPFAPATYASGEPTSSELLLTVHLAAPELFSTQELVSPLAILACYPHHLLEDDAVEVSWEEAPSEEVLWAVVPAEAVPVAVVLGEGDPFRFLACHRIFLVASEAAVSEEAAPHHSFRFAHYSAEVHRVAM